MISVLLNILLALLLIAGIAIAVVFAALVVLFVLCLIAGTIDWFIGNRRK